MDSAPDILALRRLVHTYCHRIDNGTAEAIAGLFLPEGVLHLGFQAKRPDQPGRPAIARWFAAYMTKTRQESVHNRHRVGLLDLVVQGAVATATTWWDASGIRRETQVQHVLRGHYVDAFARVAGCWYIARREIHLGDQYSIPAVRLLRPEAPLPGVCTPAWTAALPLPP